MIRAFFFYAQQRAYIYFLYNKYIILIINIYILSSNISRYTKRYIYIYIYKESCAMYVQRSLILEINVTLYTATIPKHVAFQTTRHKDMQVLPLRSPGVRLRFCSSKVCLKGNISQTSLADTRVSPRVPSVKAAFSGRASSRTCASLSLSVCVCVYLVQREFPS